MSNTETPNPVGQTESNKKDSTLSKRVIQANQKENLYASIHAYLEDAGAHAKPEGVKLKDCMVSKDDLLMRENQLWVSDNEDLRLKIIKEIYDQPAVGHSGVEKTLNMTRRHYYWPRMQQIIEQYIQNCHMCRKIKAARDTYNRLLQPLLISERS